MIKTTKYVRKPFRIDAIRVTEENLEEVATWCAGVVEECLDTRNSQQTTKYIKVRVIRPLNVRQTQAFVGDWVLYAGTGYKVYMDKAFTTFFDLAGD